MRERRILHDCTRAIRAVSRHNDREISGPDGGVVLVEEQDMQFCGVASVLRFRCHRGNHLQQATWICGQRRGRRWDGWISWETVQLRCSGTATYTLCPVMLLITFLPGRPSPYSRPFCPQKPNPPLPRQTQHNVIHLPHSYLRQSPHGRTP